MNDPVILFIDDEPQIRNLLSITLRTNGYIPNEAGTAKEGLAIAAVKPPDLILLDLGLPDQNGHEVLKQLRTWYQNPIIIVSVQGSEENIVMALDNGANDFLVKPFRTNELLARIRSALRNSTRDSSNAAFECGALSIDFISRSVKKSGVAIKLTATEYSLLSLLISNEGKVLTHRYILNQVWGPSYQQESQYLRVFIAQLRKKLKRIPTALSTFSRSHG